MKYLTEAQIDELDQEQIAPEEQFTFYCHEGLACFNRCCHNLNLFLYPYDLLRLKNGLGITSDEFIETYVDLVIRDGEYFSEVMLRMADSAEKACVFLRPQGCSVYKDRPHTCRFFPVEQGMQYDAATRRATPAYFFRPPDFCQGPSQDVLNTIATYTQHQQANLYDQMTRRWAEIRGLMHINPWGAEGSQGPKSKMAFMAAYNMEHFREFVFRSSFLKRYHVPSKQLKKIRRSENALLSLGFDWIKLFLWGIPSAIIHSV